MAALVQGHALVVGSCLENPMDRERSLAGYSPCETHGFKQNIQLLPEQETQVTPGLGVEVWWSSGGAAAFSERS